MLGEHHPLQGARQLLLQSPSLSSCSDLSWQATGFGDPLSPLFLFLTGIKGLPLCGYLTLNHSDITCWGSLNTCPLGLYPILIACYRAARKCRFRRRIKERWSPWSCFILQSHDFSDAVGILSSFRFGDRVGFALRFLETHTWSELNDPLWMHVYYIICRAFSLRSELK